MIVKSSYKAPFPFTYGHINTVFPALFRRIKTFSYVRKRMELEDGDFMDLDWSKVGSDRLVLLLHGLEGSSDSNYIKGMIKAFNRHAWDGVALNFRGCSGEPNRLHTGYHMGASADLKAVVNYIHSFNQYKELVLVGFSLGGNVLLKYLGEEQEHLPAFLKKAVAFSVPCDIPSANVEIDKWHNRLYLARFLRSLNEKLKIKSRLFPDRVQLPKGRLPRNFQEFDDYYTGPVHGFKDAQDYWMSCSSKRFVSGIKIPSLLVNAKDDSFLSEACYPYEIAQNHPFFHLETPQNGGHVGFVDFEDYRQYWSELRALDFVQKGYLND
ncbi:MAG: alpha/beta fold hydrolase [Bacteroidota bacterium]